MIRVLIVEDSPTQALKIKHAIESGFDLYGEEDSGVEIRVTDSIEGAIKLEETFRPDTIFLDLELRDASCSQTIQFIERLGKNSPVCVLTSQNDKRTMLDSYKGGADSYMDKSFSITSERLFSLITNAVCRKAFVPSYWRGKRHG